MLEANKKLALQQTIDGLKACITCLESQLKNPDDKAVIYFLERTIRECRPLKYEIEAELESQAAE
jgi:hypothetical protein|tara:strand:- start:1267 stop:1461 length:195 start_codon:yes stop_codon:yes gene_type:complete